MKSPSPPSPLSPGEARSSVTITAILARDSGDVVIFSDGFPGAGDSGDGGDGDFERIARTCAESALSRECASYEARSSSGCRVGPRGLYRDGRRTSYPA